MKLSTLTINTIEMTADEYRALKARWAWGQSSNTMACDKYIVDWSVDGELDIIHFAGERTGRQVVIVPF